MHRVPQLTPIHWADGLPPHEADRRPKHIQNWIDNAPEQRAKYPELKERLNNGNK